MSFSLLFPLFSQMLAVIVQERKFCCIWFRFALRSQLTYFFVHSISQLPLDNLSGGIKRNWRNNRWVHTSLVSRPQVYFNLTSAMNESNFNLSSLLCSRGNISCSKEPKYTSKSSSTHPYQHTYALSKQFQEIECQSNALFDEISEHARLVPHALHFRTTCLFDHRRPRRCL